MRKMRPTNTDGGMCTKDGHEHISCPSLKQDNSLYAQGEQKERGKKTFLPPFVYCLGAG